MMTDKLHVFLISADEALIDAHKPWLSRRSDLNVYRSAAACREGLTQSRPDVLIIDTALSDGEGLVLHRALRDDFDSGDLFQVLLCTEAELVLDGVTPDDQLFKPVGLPLFQRKWTQIEKRFSEAAASRSQLSYAQGVALTAMSSMGELGVVMQFLSQSFACRSIESVSGLAIESLRQYELTGVIDIVWEGGELMQSTDGEVTPAQRELITQRRTLGRLLEIEHNLVVNFPHVSILITQLPLDDPQRCGRIRDNIATLAEGIESRILGLLLEHNNLLKQQGIRYAVWEIRDSVRNLDVRQMADLAESRVLVNEVIDEFEAAFMNMGMNAEMENILINRLVDLRHRVGDIVSRPGDVHEKLRMVITALETLGGEVGLPAQGV